MNKNYISAVSNNRGHIFEKISKVIDERPICKATGIQCSNCQPVCEHRSEEK